MQSYWLLQKKINSRGKKGIGEPWKAGSAIIPIYKDSEGNIDVVIFKICSILSAASKSNAILIYTNHLLDISIEGMQQQQRQKEEVYI